MIDLPNLSRWDDADPAKSAKSAKSMQWGSWWWWSPSDAKSSKSKTSKKGESKVSTKPWKAAITIYYFYVEPRSTIVLFACQITYSYFFTW